MRSSKSYRLLNNFEKSSHLFRCRLSKGTAECWAIWEIWFESAFHFGCSLNSLAQALLAALRQPRSRQPWPHEGLPPSSVLPCVMLLQGNCGGVRSRGGFWKGSVCCSPPCRCSGPQRNRKQSWTEADCVTVQHIRAQGQEGCCKPAPPAPYPVPLLLVGVRKSDLTCWGVCFPRTKHPLTLRGWGWPKQDQRIPWSWRKTGEIRPLWALRTCKQTAWHAEPPVASLSGKLITAGFICNWKTCLWNQAI